MSDDRTEELARQWVKQNIKLLVEKFASLEKYPPVENPFTMFMAGSPGAGKTEFSKKFIEDYDPSTKIVRIDADEIRECIPQYKEGKAYKVQGAAGLGVAKLFDHVQDHSQNAIVDGTFSNFDIALKDVERALNRKRKVGIFYIYQDPFIAWDFTKKREAVEGRRVSKTMFIDSFFQAKENVNKIKEIMDNKIELHLAKKDYTNNLKKSYFNIKKVDDYIKVEYNREDLERELE